MVCEEIQFNQLAGLHSWRCKMQCLHCGGVGVLQFGRSCDSCQHTSGKTAIERMMVKDLFLSSWWMIIIVKTNG